MVYNTILENKIDNKKSYRYKINNVYQYYKIEIYLKKYIAIIKNDNAFRKIIPTKNRRSRR